MSYREYYVFHPDDTSLKTLAWLGTQPLNTYAVTISNLSDSYHGYPVFASGQGRNGKNAIRIPCSGMTETGMPNLLIYPAVSNGAGAYANVGTDLQFVVPRDKKVNRLEVWLRFPAGFKVSGAASESITENLHWGTYCSRPGGTSGNLAIGVEQSFWDGIVHGPYAQNGWHYYHQVKMRHDIVTDGEWIKIVFHGAPTHIRGASGPDMLPMNPQGPHGNYFRCLTYFYIHLVPTWWYFGGTPGFQYGGIFSEPEVPVPFDIYCDSIRFFWQDEYQPCEIRFGPNGDWFDGQEIELAASPTVNNVPFRITNLTNTSVSGTVAWRGRSSLAPQIVDQATGTIFNWSGVTFAAGETKHYSLRMTSAVDTLYPTNPEIVGVIFEPSNQFVGVGPTNADATWGQSRRSKMSGDRVQMHSIQGLGGNDYDLCYRSITFLKNGGTNATYRPTSVGGAEYRVPVTVTSQFQLPGHSPDGAPLTFVKGQSQSGRGTLTISSSGLVTYTPPSAGWEGTCHFSYQINQGTAKPSIWYGAWVNVSSKARVSIANASTGSANLVSRNGGLVTLTHGGVY